MLAGAYFFGFAATQLPLGRALDRLGPRRVLLALLSVAVLACVGFASATNFGALLAARACIGVGVSACLMAPLTAYRHHFAPTAQLRANSWMLMTGSLGMLASTLPVQWLLPVLGWRGLFWLVAGALLGLAMAVIALVVPRDAAPTPTSASAAALADAGAGASYREIFGHPYFVRLLPLGFVVYGGMVALQALWAGPWLTQVTGATAGEAARGLFAINATMLATFFVWGSVIPRLARQGWGADRLITWSVPLSLALLAGAVVLGARAGAAWWAIWCVACSAVSLSQPAVGAVFPPKAGRAGFVGFQPRHLCRRVLRPMGHWVGHRCPGGCGADPRRRAAGGLRPVRRRQRAGLRMVCLAPPTAIIEASMTALLIVAHAPLASALGAVARHCYADCAPHLALLDVTPQMSVDEAQARVAEAVAGFGAEAEVLVLTDVFGATPCSAAQRVADGQRVRVLAGVNVPMLWRTLCYLREPLGMLVERAQSGAVQGVMQAGSNRPQHQAPRATSDAQGHRHDQQ